MRSNVWGKAAFAEWPQRPRLPPVIALPPYALTPPTFRFRALVALAERLPLGGDRELVLATFVSARLLWDWSVADAVTPASQARAMGARQWLQSMSLSAATRGVFQQLADAAGHGDRPGTLAAWERIMGLASRAIEGVSRADFKLLSARLDAGALP